MRVGIWCAYHVTLLPTEGIGVFAHNLALGLSKLSSISEVIMVTRPGDEPLINSTTSRGAGKIKAFSPESFALSRQPAPQESDRQHLAIAVERHRFNLRRLGTRSSQHYQQKFQQKLDKRLGQSRNVWLRNQATTIAGWLACYAGKVRKESIRIRLRKAERALSKLYDPTELLPTEALVEHCDVWLIPYVGLDQEFSKPTVVTIHDLVAYHFPEMMTAEQLSSLKSLVDRVAEQSTIAACMSRFIESNDLLGELNLPQSKVRMVAPAPPDDFASPALLSDVQERYPILNQPYVLYPSAFRHYKNHRALIEALAFLSDQGDEQIQVAFTGTNELPSDLKRLAKSLRVEHRVHTLGKCPRDVLSLLYQKAVATIVPSLYEQGSFPLMEALHWGCPIAAANIPPLVEQFSPLGDSMLFFDPHNYEELARVMRKVHHNRQATLDAQQKQKATILGRTWEEAAHDWEQVFFEAIQMHRSNVVPMRMAS